MEIKNVVEAIEKLGHVHAELMKSFTGELRMCWIVSQTECINYLTDDEFETLQGLIKKVEIKKEMMK